MRKLALCFAVLLFFAVSGVAQSDTSSSSTSTSSTTTSTTKTKKAKSSKTAGGEHQVTGCLAGPNDEGVYTLTNGRYTKGLEVGGNDELKNHVGHEVTLKGTWGTAEDITEKPNTAENEKAEKHMKVSSIKMVSDSCPTHAAKKGKKGKAAPTS
ncbi:MAG TPA: hypothetical protein VK699_07740 [Terriglobales bacterium]|jgi:hypothetical protein|nr:hypothetical protein [Terriglobales bacterium]